MSSWQTFMVSAYYLFKEIVTCFRVCISSHCHQQSMNELVPPHQRWLLSLLPVCHSDRCIIASLLLAGRNKSLSSLNTCLCIVGSEGSCDYLEPVSFTCWLRGKEHFFSQRKKGI